VAKKIIKVVKKSEKIVAKEVVYSDLKQVMDYKRDFTMFYSGVEYEAYLDGCYNMGVRNFLMSYEYLKGKGSSQLRKYADMHLFIDSGAYTYMNDPKFQEFTIEQWEEQIVKYLSWAEKHKESIFGMAELDLQYLVGIDKVQEWRRNYFEPFMLRTGVPVCFIYHNDGMHIWEQMCERYPYVGFSSVSDDGNNRSKGDYKKMLSVAEKYNAVVHGFGMTKTSLLPELPFYTVDSTSWKSGFRYGLLSIWNGRKVQQFKKEEWEERVLPVLRNYTDISFDEPLLWDFYEPEILRASVYAYQRAETYIVEHLKPLTYWKKQRAIKVDINAIPSNFFPPVEWFEDFVGYKEYAVKMNINPEYEDAKGLVSDITMFLNWDNSEYAELKKYYEENPEVIVALHDMYVNRIVATQEDKIKDLKTFFLDCIAGKNDRLLQMGTNFDRVSKEREDYIEEDEFEYVDIPQEEYNEVLVKCLPSPTEEKKDIDELDEEIFDMTGFLTVRDNKGRFIKGQKAVRRPKNLYSEKYPKLVCNTCYASQTCPEYKGGMVCAYNKLFKRFDCRDTGDILEAMQGMVNLNMERMQTVAVFEKLNGGIPDGNLTAMINQNMSLLGNIKQIYEKGGEILRHTKTIDAEGNMHETTSVRNGGQSILEKMFGDSTPKATTPKVDAEGDIIIDVEVKDETTD
jgi:hypothetical protein